ncbi:hypothetical protein O9G_001525 [Rozella allomycis CSF55]|uniref:Mis18 domain-containing protein n=1 Tax=Rozella allomycis (strain CSF55) TaxID=988480 RepID=A0A075B4W9_ROZAC|nr:hypothetical protein O9G_001525 [Rozella allomycis CSF55]|eukprot:EPZ36541.1 hypothetical protein O9G_001525 [Rozella allomycis CSF55]
MAAKASNKKRKKSEVDEKLENGNCDTKTNVSTEEQPLAELEATSLPITIVSDSISWNGIDMNLMLMSVKSITPFARKSDKTKSDSSKNKYMDVECGNCGVGIGKYYIETEPDMADLFRGQYALEVSKILTYQLGMYLNNPKEAEETYESLFGCTHDGETEENTKVIDRIIKIEERLNQLEKRLID